MKKTMKWTIMLAAAMMLIALAGSAMADDRVYTSPSFCIPGSRIEIPVNEQTAEETEAEPETTADETVPAETVNETETVLPESEQEETTAVEAEMINEAAAETEAAEELTAEAETTDETTAETEAAEELNAETETTDEAAVEAEAAEDPTAESEITEETAETEENAAEQTEAEESAAAVPEETAEPAEEPDDYDELAEEPAAGTDVLDAAPETEKIPEERQVLVRSSRRDTVTGGEVIELTSQLVGFGEAEVHYQWQVDRNDGAGWVDAEDGNRWKYTFLADRTTVMYNWRLIVTVDE